MRFHLYLSPRVLTDSLGSALQMSLQVVETLLEGHRT